MQQAANDTGRDAALDFARGVAAAWDRHLGQRLVGISLIGSLAHDGFSARYSDIDLAVIVEDGLTQQDLGQMAASAASYSAALAPKLSLFWTDRHFSVGRFPPLDRADLIDHGTPIIERQHVRPPRPTLAEIRAYLGGAPLQNWSRQAERFSTLPQLAGDNRKAYLRALLYPARFAYSWTTGAMASNDDAVAWLRPHAAVGFEIDLIERALRCRNDALDPDHLFAERSKLLRQRDACLQLVADLP